MSEPSELPKKKWSIKIKGQIIDLNTNDAQQAEKIYQKILNQAEGSFIKN